MYYQNGNYMQDLNYYNQTPNLGYNPYINNNFQNQNMGMQNQMPIGQQNLNAMYPAVYRIISPVVSQVLSNNNTGYLTEDALNNMVDSVYRVVEGDINLGNNSNVSNNASNENAANTNCERNSSTSRQNNTNVATSGSNSQNSLLRDLIKIMILNEIISRRQNNTNQMMMPNMMGNNMQNTNMNQPMFM